jgi:hypothetical protein
MVKECDEEASIPAHIAEKVGGSTSGESYTSTFIVLLMHMLYSLVTVEQSPTLHILRMAYNRKHNTCLISSFH